MVIIKSGNFSCQDEKSDADDVYDCPVYRWVGLSWVLFQLLIPQHDLEAGQQGGFLLLLLASNASQAKHRLHPRHSWCSNSHSDREGPVNSVQNKFSTFSLSVSFENCTEREE